VRSALQLMGRIERLETAAEQASTPTIGQQIVDILERRAQGPRLSVEELSRCKVGRLLLQRRARAGLGYQA
jgi:hypothetical protein